MADLNPYESPKVLPDNKLAIAAAKKAVGLTTLVILTPIAVFLAGCISCAAVFPTVYFVGEGTRNLGEGSYTWMFAAGWGVFLIPPIIVLGVMIRWGLRIHCREEAERKQKRLESWKAPVQD